MISKSDSKFKLHLSPDKMTFAIFTDFSFDDMLFIKEADIMKNSFKKNILLIVFFIFSGVVSWAVIFTLLWEGADSFTASTVSTLFMASILIHAHYTDKWWNIPCMTYILLTLTGAFSYLIHEDFPPMLNLFNYTSIISFIPFAGTGYCFRNDTEHLYLLIILFCLISLAIMIKKYFRKENSQ